MSESNNNVINDSNHNYMVKFTKKNQGSLNITNQLKESTQRPPTATSTWSKYIYTIIILVEYLNSAFIGSLFASAMVDMKYLFETSMATTAYVNTFISLGYVCGSMLGFLYDYLNRQVTSIVMTLIMGVSLTIMPVCPNIWTLYISAFLANLGSGGFDSGSYLWVIDMWKHHYSPVLHSTQMMFGLGNILAPLLMRAFIVGDITKNPEYSQYLTQLNINTTSNDEINYTIERKSKLIIPYSIAGSITTAVPLALFIMYFVSKYKASDENLKNTVNTDKYIVDDVRSGNKLARSTLIILIGLSINSFNGLLLGHMFYSSTYYQYLPLGITASKAAEILSLMSTTFTVGRLIAVFIAIKTKTEIMIAYHLIILFISMIFSYYGQNSITFIWIANALIGLGSSGLWASYFSLTEQYIKMTDKISSVLLFSSQFIIVLTPFLIGPLIEEQPQTLIYLEIACLSLTIVLFAIILLMVRKLKPSS